MVTLEDPYYSSNNTDFNINQINNFILSAVKHVPVIEIR